jgi:hypothetical protein
MPYEKVSKGDFGGKADPLISLRKSESIGINQPALDEFFSEDVSHVVVYHDEENNNLGIAEDDGSDDDAYKLSISDSGATIGCTSKLKQMNLVPEVTTRYTPSKSKLNEDTEIVEIDLDNPHSTYGSADDSTEEKES